MEGEKPEEEAHGPFLEKETIVSKKEGDRQK